METKDGEYAEEKVTCNHFVCPVHDALRLCGGGRTRGARGFSGTGGHELHRPYGQNHGV